MTKIKEESPGNFKTKKQIKHQNSRKYIKAFHIHSDDTRISERMEVNGLNPTNVSLCVSVGVSRLQSKENKSKLTLHNC